MGLQAIYEILSGLPLNLKKIKEFFDTIYQINFINFTIFRSSKMIHLKKLDLLDLFILIGNYPESSSKLMKMDFPFLKIFFFKLSPDEFRNSEF